VRPFRPAAAAALALLLALPAAAGDPLPDFEKSMQVCRDLVKREQWAAGETALRKVFADFPNDARVRARLREIEDQLKLCLFRKSLPPVKGDDLFGAASKRFNPATRDVELFFGSPTGQLWEQLDNGVRVLQLRLEGSFTFEVSMSYLNSDDRVSAAFICYDLEKRGGYLVLPGYYAETATTRLSAPVAIRKLGKAGEADLKNRSPGVADYRYGAALKIVRSSSDITVSVGPTVVAKTSDSSFTTGYLGFRADRASSVSVKGRIDRHAYRKMIAQRFGAQFSTWEASVYSRETEIPEWARESALAAPDVTLTELPADAPPADRHDLTQMVELAAGGDDEEGLHLQVAAGNAPPRTALYLRGVGEIALGSYKTAEEALERVVAEEPDFVAARLFRGIARFHLRQTADARADLEWVLARRPRASEAVVFSAIIAMFDQDYDRAEALLGRADEAGVVGEDVEQIRDWVNRARRGPNLAQRFEQTTAHFVVVSDHSQKVCADAAALLESMQLQYAAALRPVPGNAPKARVYVFSGPEGYFDYASDLGVSADSSAGVYLPMLRELVIWIPVDMTDFTDTVRHEGFHQYLHRLVDDAPVWFNEGYAEVMGGGGPEGIRDARRDGEWVKKFVPVRDLVAMKHEKFMEIAGVAYTESRYLIDFLRRTKHDKLRNVLRDYFAALTEGLSQADANRRVLEPVMDVLQSEFTRSL
jgi:tetratricopeptide (TPR) repeat protein